MISARERKVTASTVTLDFMRIGTATIRVTVAGAQHTFNFDLTALGQVTQS